jgi:integrase
MAKPDLRIVSSTTVKRKVTPRRPKNADVRTREYLTEKEVEQLIEGCGGNRWPHRDQTMILIAFRHGLRASELCDLQWTQVDFEAANLAVTRAKHGTPSTHPLTGRELRALRRLHREAEGQSPFLFVSERGSPMTVSNFQKLISRACETAGLKIKAHPHMLRHACGSPSTTRRVRPAMAYWIIHEWTPLVRTRRPKPGRSSSKKTLSVTPGDNSRVRILAVVSFIEISPRDIQGTEPNRS